MQLVINTCTNIRHCSIPVDSGPITHGPSWECSFEDPEDRFCGMIQDFRLDNFDWTVQSGTTPSSETGPDHASHGDHYIYIEASSPRRPGDRAM